MNPNRKISHIVSLRSTLKVLGTSIPSCLISTKKLVQNERDVEMMVVNKRCAVIAELSAC